MIALLFISFFATYDNVYGATKVIRMYSTILGSLLVSSMVQDIQSLCIPTSMYSIVFQVPSRQIDITCIPLLGNPSGACHISVVNHPGRHVVICNARDLNITWSFFASWEKLHIRTLMPPERTNVPVKLSLPLVSIPN